MSVIRSLVLLCVASSDFLWEDPAGFLQKIMERIRQATRISTSLKIPGKLTAAFETSADQHLKRGAYTEALKSVALKGRTAKKREIRQARRAGQALRRLVDHVPAGAPLKPTGEPVRVLHVLTNSKPYTNSGYTVRSHNVLKTQEAHGISVLAATRLGYPVLVGKLPAGDEQVIDGIRYRRVIPWRYPSNLQQRDDVAVQQVVRIAKEFGATILHTTTDYKNALVVSRAAQALGLPWVYEVRGELESTWVTRQPVEHQEAAYQSEYYRLARRQETRSMQAASAVVALSEVSKAGMVERGVAPEKIAVVPNAADSQMIGMDFDQEAVRRELELPVDSKLFGSVTAVVGYEGLHRLVDSITYLPSEWELLLVGDGTELPALRKRAEELGVDKRCHFVGRKPSEEIWKWYASLDVFAVPRVDSAVTRTVTPIKPLTAQGLGIPVVTSDLPALREVTGGEALYVDAEAEASEWARAIEAAFGMDVDPEVVRNRTWEANGKKYARLYAGEITQ